MTGISRLTVIFGIAGTVLVLLLTVARQKRLDPSDFYSESDGRDATRIEVAPFVNVIVSDDVAGARNQARLPLAYYVGGMGDYYHASLSRLGFGAEADRVRELWQAGRRKDAMAVISDELVDSIAICGSVDHCRSRLDEMYTLGATVPLIPIPTEGSAAEKCRVIDSFRR